MLPAKNRLPSQIHQLSGRRVNTPLFLVIYTSNRQANPRLRFVVSKKISPLAVVRNRIKRQLAHAFHPALHALPGVDIVCIARPAINRANSAQIHQAVHSSLQHIVSHAHV